MPRIIDYSTVSGEMSRRGFECNYPNGGAFGFPAGVPTYIRGWMGPDDPTIKPSALRMARRVPDPHAANLAELLTHAWRQKLPGNAWVMPMSHWHYELHFGSSAWMPALLEEIEIDQGMLADRANAAAIEFRVGETLAFSHFTGQLLAKLRGSDFLIAWCAQPVVSHLHHHRQVWWISSDSQVISNIDEIGPNP